MREPRDVQVGSTLVHVAPGTRDTGDAETEIWIATCPDGRRDSGVTVDEAVQNALRADRPRYERSPMESLKEMKARHAAERKRARAAVKAKAHFVEAFGGDNAAALGVARDLVAELSGEKPADDEPEEDLTDDAGGA